MTSSSCPACGNPVDPSNRQCPHCGVPYVVSGSAGRFDPYHQWLGIPPREQPANFYRLLGIATFERDLKVIENAADRQMAHVRRFQAKHPVEAGEVLRALNQARVTLLSERKAAYDRSITSAADRRVPAPPPAPGRPAGPARHAPPGATRPAPLAVQPASKPAGRLVACPSCDTLISSSVKMCPHCGDPFVNLAGTESPPPPPPPIVMAPRVSTSQAPQSMGPQAPVYQAHVQPGRTQGERVAKAAIVLGLIGMVSGVALGAFASQFFPVFGGFLIQIAEPFSPARLQTLPAHCIVGGIAGSLFLGCLGALVQATARPALRRERSR